MPPRLYPTSMPFANCEQHVRDEEANHNEAAAVFHAGREVALLLGVRLLTSYHDSASPSAQSQPSPSRRTNLRQTMGL